MFQPSRPPSAYKTPYISDPLSHIGKFGATIIGFKLLTCSSRSVFFPHEARYLAAELPSTPAPTTQTSKRSPVIAILKQPWNGDSTNKRTGDFRESARFYPYLQIQIWKQDLLVLLLTLLFTSVNLRVKPVLSAVQCKMSSKASAQAFIFAGTCAVARKPNRLLVKWLILPAGSARKNRLFCSKFCSVPAKGL